MEKGETEGAGASQPSLLPFVPPQLEAYPCPFVPPSPPPAHRRRDNTTFSSRQSRQSPPMASTNPTAPVSGGDTLPSQAYANAFLPLKPREATTLLQTRIHKARILTEELADYFAARRDLEATYLKALQKMAKRSFLSDPQALGVGFAPVYER